MKRQGEKAPAIGLKRPYVQWATESGIKHGAVIGIKQMGVGTPLLTVQLDDGKTVKVRMGNVVKMAQPSKISSKKRGK